MSDRLKSLYFGKDDAESDITNGGLLSTSFLETYAYRAALQGRKFLVVGRKGSGKSAICLRILSDLSPSSRASLVTPDEISAEEIRRFELQGILPEQSKLLIWRYAFSVTIAKALLTSLRGRDETSDDFARLRKFLVDNGEISTLTIGEKFWRMIEKIKASLSLEAFGVKVSGEIETKPSGIRASEQLDVVEQHLGAALQNAGTFTVDSPFYLLVDQIERVWSNDKSSDQLVIGLLLAVKHFTKFPQVRCVVSLRTDIYEFLQFGDRDKFRGDELRIDWTKQQILNLMVSRAQTSAGQCVSEGELFSRVFPARVGDTATSDFLVQRTLMRPRDIIQFANACRDTAEKNGHTQIKVSDVQEAAVLYSTWKLSDLLNEWRINYPFLNDVLLLFSSASYAVDRDTVRGRFELVRDTLVNRYPTFAAIFSLEGLLSILFRIGFLGLLRNGDANYAYDGTTSIEPSDNAFVVHPCFREALKCSSAIEVSPYDSIQFGEELIDQVRREKFADRYMYENVRGFRSGRAIKEIRYQLEKLTDVFARSRSIPAIGREEVIQSIRAIMTDLGRLPETEDSGDAALDVATSAARHLNAISDKMATKAWLEPDVESALYECIHSMRMLRSGALMEYR